MDKEIKQENIVNLLKANKRLERQLGMVKALSNAVLEGIYIVERDGTVLFSNDYGRKILNLSGDGDDIFKALGGLEEDILSSLETGLAAEKEMEISYPEHRILKANIVPFNPGDHARSGAVSLVLTDITREKLSTFELIESEKIASILKLASGIAHEIGNPLNSMSIHLQLSRRNLAKLGAEKAVKKVDESIKVCEGEIERLKGIIENFLKALRPIRPEFKELDAIAPLMDTLKVLEAQLKDKKISVDISDTSTEKLPSILGDDNLLRQLYFNIIKNSIEALEEGGKITVLANADDESVNMDFIDDGCGMSRENLAHMFEPYFTTKDYGHGLGMMIIENIVRAHGGSVRVDSAVGEGTKISVKIPRKNRRVRFLGAK